MKKNLTYSVIVTTSLISLILFFSGFVLGIQNVLSSDGTALPTLPKEAATTTENWNIVALGDSLTRGIGDIEGKGYISILQQALTLSDNNAQLTNLAVSGATSSDLVQQLTNNGILRTISQANLLVITIGGNDLFHSAELQEINFDKIPETSQLYLSNLKIIVSSIREVNKTAPIYFLGLYNPFADLNFSEITTRIVLEWNFQTQLTTSTYENLNYVPIADIFDSNLSELLYTDHFHPNQEGYKRIGNRLIQLISPMQ